MTPALARVCAGLSVASALVVAGPAAAACHAFTVSVSPASVTEGSPTTVTVERDAAVGESSVRVRTVAGTAKAGSDYVAVDRTVEFTDGTERSFVVGTRNDNAAESAESFQVELVEGSGGGCAANPNFQYGPPATVTIRANDQPVATRPPTQAPTTTAPPATRAPTSSPTTVRPRTTAPATRTSAPVATSAPATTAAATTSAPPAVLLSPAASPTRTAVAERSSGGGGLATGLGALAALVLAAVAGFFGVRRLRG